MNVRLQCAAILFDMDGTLVDSTAIVERAWKWWGDRHGIPVEQILAFSHGRPTIATMDHFRPGHDNSLEAAEMLDYEETEIKGIVPVPGAVAAVTAAMTGLWAVVTSAPRRLAEIRLSLAGLAVPPVLVGADETDRGKPHPDPYLLAAGRLGISPADCCVFEDTGPGIEAGVRAGMQAVGLLTTVPREQLATEHVIRDFRDVQIASKNGGFEILLSYFQNAATTAPIRNKKATM